MFRRGQFYLLNEFYQKLQQVLDKVNRNDYILLILNLNARIINQHVEQAVYLKYEITGEKTRRFMFVQLFSNNGDYLTTKTFTNSPGKQ